MSDHLNQIAIIIMLLFVAEVFAFIFFACELGERISDRFDVFNAELSRCDWNLLSIKMQRMYLIFLLSTQQPVHIKCYGDIVCTRETFKEVHSTYQRIKTCSFCRQSLANFKLKI